MSKINKRPATEKATKNTEVLLKEKEDLILDHAIYLTVTIISGYKI